MSSSSRVSETLERIECSGIVAVLRAPDHDLALAAVDALVAGGIDVVEITMTNPAAISVVRHLTANHADHLLVGVGSLYRPDDADRALQAGASFLVSPHVDLALARAMAATGLAVSIGALTPTEVASSVELGSHIVKLFPGSLGGPAYLKSLREPLPDVRFMPTGGVTHANLAEWVEAGAVAVGVGGGLSPRHAIENRDGALITANARRLVAAWAAAHAPGEQIP